MKLILHGLFQFYLNGRSQRIRIQGCFSDEKPVSSGVHQGSIVASLLFISYINDLPDFWKSVYPLLCADDAKFITINKPNLHYKPTYLGSKSRVIFMVIH